MRRPSAALVLLLVLALAPACSTSGHGLGAATDGRLQVVAAENFWGSLAAQLGGNRVDVTDLIRNPNTDPHDYEATANDARAVAEADYLIVNGVGYDGWASKSAAASPSSRRLLLDVGDLTGHHAGDNPHRWYFPADVEKVIDRITADYQQLDPAHAAYFASRRAAFETTGLATYHRLLADIARRFAGTPVGASESIFVGIAQATGLHLLTPDSFLNGVSEGTDITAQAKTTVDRQISERQVAVFVSNTQNATPDVQRVVASSRSHHIPVVTITETLAPAGDTFQQWQVAQLRGLEAALHEATGR